MKSLDGHWVELTIHLPNIENPQITTTREGTLIVEGRLIDARKKAVEQKKWIVATQEDGK